MGVSTSVKPFLYLFLVVSILFSCKKKEVEIPNHLIGIWDVDYSEYKILGDSLDRGRGFRFELELKKNGKGIYGFQNFEDEYDVTWSPSFDGSMIFLTIENTSNPNQIRLSTRRFEILTDEPNFQLWRYVVSSKKLEEWEMTKR